MKYSLALVALIIFSTDAVLAQPTITRSWLGQPGEIITSRQAKEVPDVSPTGADVTWDFSQIEPADTFLIAQMFVDADTTKFKASFPSANNCLFATYDDPDVGDISFYDYSRATDNVWENIGSVLTTSQFLNLNTFSDPQTLVTFPFTYQSQASDDFKNVLDISSMGITIVETYGEGTVNVTADAWGTVMLPGGTFDNCLRVRYETQEVDSTDLGLGIVEKAFSKSTSWVWISLSHPAPIANYEESESFVVALVQQLPPDTSETEFDTIFSWDQTAISSSTKYYQPEAFDFGISPNPFNSDLTLTFALDRPEEMRFEIQTVNGQVVYSQKLSGVTGSNTLNIRDVQIPAGTYIAALHSHSRAAVQKLVKVD